MSGGPYFLPLRTRRQPSTNDEEGDHHHNPSHSRMSHVFSFGPHRSPSQVESQFLQLPNVLQAPATHCPAPGSMSQAHPHSPDEYLEHNQSQEQLVNPVGRSCPVDRRIHARVRKLPQDARLSAKRHLSDSSSDTGCGSSRLKSPNVCLMRPMFPAHSCLKSANVEVLQDWEQVDVPASHEGPCQFSWEWPPT